jgi:hypothetical protein
MVISATTDDPAIAKVTAIAGMLLMGDALGGAGLSAAESGAVIGFTTTYAISPITTDVVNSNLDQAQVYNIM